MTTTDPLPSMDLRQRVLQDCDSGLPTQAVADKYRVSPAWVRRLKQRRRQSGRVALSAPRRPPPVWAAHADRPLPAERASAAIGRAVHHQTGRPCRRLCPVLLSVLLAA
ncbi:MAG TPA: helix-turn-helix domain-containing protein [Gemmataceae bacterium]